MSSFKSQKVIISSTIELYVNDLSKNKKDKIKSRDSIFEYLNDEKFLEKDNIIIQLKAMEMKGKNSEETLKNIYSFVNNKIEYTGYNTKSQGALVALQTRAGDCTEFSDLFVALCRSSNIPSRVVEGLTLDFNNTPRHSWAEVYLNKYGWVRFDPTKGNFSTFETMENRYIQLSCVRNDQILNYYHFWADWYWGDSVKVNLNLEISPL